VFILSLSVFFSCSDGENAVSENEHEEEEFEEGEILRGFDLWTEMRAYPNKEIKAPGFSRAFIEARQMSIQARSEALEMDLPNTAPWSELAPLNFSGRILCVALHPSDPNTMYVGSASGGLWKTTNGGTGNASGINWTNIPTGFPVNGIASVAINPSNPNEIYIGTGEVYSISPGATGTIGHGGAERTFRGSYGIGILKTTDGGVTWTKTLDFAASNLKGVMDMAINPASPSTVFAATTDGIYRTQNSGSTWTLIHNIVLANSMALKPGNPDVLYVGSGNFGSTGAGIYRCTNANAVTPSFTQLTTGLPAGITGKIEISVTPINVDAIYASIGNSPAGGPEGMYKSLNGGNTWNNPNGSTAVIGSQGWYGHDIAVSRANVNLVLWGELNFYRSANGGTSISNTGIWSNWNINNTTVGTIQEGINTSYVHADVHSIVASPHDPSGNTFFICTDGGLFRTTNGGTAFQTLNGGLNTAQIYANAAISATNRDFMVLGLQDNEAFIYAGSPGCRRIGSLGDGFHAAIDPTNENRSYMESYFLRIDRTTDKWVSGANRTGINSNGSGLNVTDSACFNAPFVLSPSNPSVMYGGTVKMFKFTNVNASPVKATMNGGANLSGPSQPILTMAISSTSDQVVYASTVPKLGVRSRIYRTTNGGTSFTNITGTLPDRYYSKIAVDPTNHNRIAVALSGFGTSHVYLSTNAGTNWTDISSGLPDVPHNTLAFDPDNVGVLYVGTDNGVYYAQNIPLSTVAASLSIPWTSYNDGFPDGVMVSDLVFTPSPRKIRMATFGRGLWERDLAPYIALPVNLESFDAVRDNDANLVTWKVSGEANVQRYEIEYSMDGSRFTNVGTESAKNLSAQSYSYSYRHTAGRQSNAYYRIKIIDNDGSFKYSTIKKVSAPANRNNIYAYPNPTMGQFYVHIPVANNTNVQYKVVDMSGKVLVSRHVPLSPGYGEFKGDLTAFPAGQYRIIIQGRDINWKTTIIKTK
jgi:hypothetical protein